ncbi:phosphate ABC transporter, permease protein PstA [Synechococcus sp. PCC 7335]|uniref:phosphate ABC transporter permease PstA n=1 Tax=Synechococcus sp. (strain ATCC 29403 / PCC 7335) TaxID=91464 RepID=UPI00017EE3E8|nr:phosphate ABC transporter permease PstA [Synechococcus sp. PCC 7335]EDX86811.1 phosphate ABC transporter, permease protein PstA [Synechococcus sp. PCC 7335]
METNISSRPQQNAPQGAQKSSFAVNLNRRYTIDRIFKAAAWGATIVSVVILAWLLLTILMDGLGTLNWNFVTSFPSRKAERAGIVAALAGTVWLMGLVALFAFPIGVGAGIYLEEFAGDNWFTRFVEINIGNLAGVPSIIYGLLGLAVFVRIMEPITGGRSVLSGSLTISLLILPIVIVATREALRAIPESLRLAGYALGATRWQVVRSHVLPAAAPGILTGMILALSRAIGETASLIAVGAAVFISFLPEGLNSQFTAMPIQIYNWISRPQDEFHYIAASGIIVLMTALLVMNGLAIYLRNRFQQEKI